MPILKKPELYSPGGSLDKSIKAFSFGADAVYYGLNKFGLRKIKSDNEFDDLQKLLSYANANNKKVDITLNSFLKNNDLNQYFDYFKKMLELEVDGIIVSDPAAVLFYNKVRSKNKLEKTILILSTQTNLTNYSSVHFWYNQGVKRFVLARELSLVEIYEIKKYLIRKKLDAEIETFIHGAMCVSISGRCLLSLYMTTKNLAGKQSTTARDANKGECIHPCRFAYLVERERPLEKFPIEEDEVYSYILSSKDLRLLRQIPLFIIAQVDALKIEGRMKSSLYASSLSLAYRKAIDMAYELVSDMKLSEEKKIAFLEDPSLFYNYCPEWEKKVEDIFQYTELASHRPYTTGFYFPKSNLDLMVDPQDNELIQMFEFIAEGYDLDSGLIFIENNLQNQILKLADKLHFSLLNEMKEKEEKNFKIYYVFAKNSAKLDKKDLQIFTNKGLCKLENYIVYDINNLNKTEEIKHSNKYFFVIIDENIQKFAVDRYFFIAHEKQN